MTQHPERPDGHDHHYRDDRELDEQLRRLAAGLDAPVVPLAGDLARGHARLVRQRIVIGGACLAVVGVLGIGASLAPELGSAAERPDYAGNSASPNPSPSATDSSPAEANRTKQARNHKVNPLPPGIPESDDETLTAYERVLAEHLDPQWDHLVKYTQANGNQQTGSNGGDTTSLGSKYGWKNAGESGLGMLQVSVSAGWSGTDWLCGASAATVENWSCHDVPAPGSARSAEVAVHDGVVEAAVEHQDGQVVILSASNLFANNSTVSVSGLDVSEAQLARAAADERLSLPGGAPDVPPVIGASTFERAGREVLLRSGETLGSINSGGDSDAWVDGRWSDDAQNRGELSWDATPLTAPSLEQGGCFPEQFTRCEHPVVGGKRVLLGYVRAKWGGGWQAIYDGPSYEVRVVFTPAYDGAEFPQDRALALVTDERLQPLN